MNRASERLEIEIFDNTHNGRISIHAVVSQTRHRLPDRIRLVVQSAFNGRRILIFSGGAAKGLDDVYEEIRGIHEGGGFGSIIGRNSFQRQKSEAITMLHNVMDIYAEKAVAVGA